MNTVTSAILTGFSPPLRTASASSRQVGARTSAGSSEPSRRCCLAVRAISASPAGAKTVIPSRRSPSAMPTWSEWACVRMTASMADTLLPRERR